MAADQSPDGDDQGEYDVAPAEPPPLPARAPTVARRPGPPAAPTGVGAGAPPGPGAVPDRLPIHHRHDACGQVTAMPESVARTIRQDPCYHTRSTVCAFCGEVPENQCVYVETGQRLGDYRAAVLRAKGWGYHLVRHGLWVALAAYTGLVGWWTARTVQGCLIGAGVGAGIGLLWGHLPRLLLCKMRVI